MNAGILKRFSCLIPADRLHPDEPMSKHTTFQVGGPADLLAEAANISELVKIRTLCEEEALPYIILGNGSNLLVSDKGYRGVVISLVGDFTTVETEEDRVRAGAAALLSKVSRSAAKRSLTGLEFASGIPGSVGGAVRMNAGAYGSEIKDVLAEATVLAPDNSILILPTERLDLGYRTSCVETENYIVLEALFSLAAGDPKEIDSRMDELTEKRRSKQPLEYPSAGSTFKRPEGYFAGKLIEDAGLRGYTLGGAQVSEKHCGFVINRGDATADDIYRLCMEVRRRVFEDSGVELEMEVKLLGEF